MEFHVLPWQAVGSTVERHGRPRKFLGFSVARHGTSADFRGDLYGILFHGKFRGIKKRWKLPPPTLSMAASMSPMKESGFDGFRDFHTLNIVINYRSVEVVDASTMEDMEHSTTHCAADVHP